MRTIKAEFRSPQAKARQLRRVGLIPCCVFGTSLPASLLLQMDEKKAEKLLRDQAAGSTVELELDGKTIPVMIKEITRNAVNSQLEQIGFQALQTDKKINSVAHIVFTNREKAAGFVNQIVDQIPYAAYPGDLVNTVPIDLAQLPVGVSLTIDDLALAKNEKLELQLPGDTVVLHITEMKRASLQRENADA